MIHKISVPEGDDQDRAYDDVRQDALDAETFDAPRPPSSKCASCDHIGAQLVCPRCGAERPEYTRLKARLAELPPSLAAVGDHNAAEVLRILQESLGGSVD